MKPSDVQWEKKLRILTGAGDYEKDDAHHSRYEPTGYDVLMRLAESGLIVKGDTLVDYGCGKGRVSLFLNHMTGCRSVGVEFDEALHAAAQKNLLSCRSTSARDGQVRFELQSAENYVVSEENCFYFFNPFSVEILRSVLSRIFDSCYDFPKTIHLFFYYALDSYLTLLASEDRLQPAGEIDVRDLFGNNDSREKILIFRIDPLV